MTKDYVIYPRQSGKNMLRKALNALVAIRELHTKTYWTAQDEVWELNAKCNECHTAYPCETLKLADEVLDD